MPVCPACGTSYGPTVRICVHDGTPLTSENRTDKYIGTLLEGKYRIDALVGAGGMGSVYRGEHVMLGKTVAVKVINHHLVTSDEVVVRFQREARAVASLDHPNIVAVYDLGQLPDGTLYIAMEYIDGPTLKSRIRAQGPLSPAEAVGLLRQVASALGFAHRKLIVHRDLKSDNLMLEADEQGGTRVKLVDFGIAKTFDESTQLTVAGYMMGTPHYMSPEQAAGAEVDHRADIYSLGVILYEALTGQVPFGDGTLSSVLVRLATEVPAPPSLRYTEGQIPPALDVVVMRCLEKDPDRRFQSADDFADALESAALEPDTRTLVRPAIAAPGATLVRPVRPPTPAAGAGKPGPAVPSSAGSGAPATPGRDALAAAAAKREYRLTTLLALAVVIIAAAAAAAIFVFYRGDAEPDPTPTATTRSTDPGGRAANPPAGRRVDSDARPPVSEQPAAPRATTPPPTAPRQEGRAATRTSTPVAPAAREAVPPATQQGPPAKVDTPVTDARAAAPPTPPARTGPLVSVECEGVSEVCGVLRAELVRAMQAHALLVVGIPSAADIAVTASVKVVSARPSMQGGAQVITQTYAVELEASGRQGSVPMPAQQFVDYEQMFGRARLQQSAQAIAGGAAEAVRSFADRR